MLDPQSIPHPLSPSVRRSFDASEANAIINDPAVFPLVTVPGLETIDIAPVIADHRNILLMAEGGAIIFSPVELSVYELHTNFLPSHRGKHAIAASREAYRWMFTHTDCLTILTKIPAFNRPAAVAARIVGFTPLFMRKAVWPTADGNVDLKFYEMSYQDWLHNAAPELMASGRAFHACLESERTRHNHPEPKGHANEDCHDLYVGAALEMVYAGQPEKAAILYNSWARFAGYGMIALLSRSPLVIDIGDAVLLFEDSSFKVIKCRQEQ